MTAERQSGHVSPGFQLFARPHLPGAQAWQTATASGVPDNAVAQVMYYRQRRLPQGRAVRVVLSASTGTTSTGVRFDGRAQARGRRAQAQIDRAQRSERGARWRSPLQTIAGSLQDLRALTQEFRRSRQTDEAAVERPSRDARQLCPTTGPACSSARRSHAGTRRARRRGRTTRTARPLEGAVAVIHHLGPPRCRARRSRSRSATPCAPGRWGRANSWNPGLTCPLCRSAVIFSPWACTLMLPPPCPCQVASPGRDSCTRIRSGAPAAPEIDGALNQIPWVLMGKPVPSSARGSIALAMRFACAKISCGSTCSRSDAAMARGARPRAGAARRGAAAGRSGRRSRRRPARDRVRSATRARAAEHEERRDAAATATNGEHRTSQDDAGRFDRRS